MWGGTNFNPPSFDPALRLFFVTARETCATYQPQEPEIAPGRIVVRRRRADAIATRPTARCARIDADDRRAQVGVQVSRQPTMAGVMSTASGLVFAGDNEGNFMAFDSRTGKNLWRYSTGTPIWGAAPMTYMLDGRQYVVIASGTTLLSFALPGARPSLR